ncbi:iron-containing alcohol dehydrogenase [Desulfobacterales bacterium HSG16]|nr:iron-containing alcohol dehydrogenase [Desulfobacterales bacterium HSG16]
MGYKKDFEFSTAVKILFGSGTINQAGLYAETMGQRTLVVLGSNVKRGKCLIDLLKQQNIETAIFSIPEEPSVELVEQGVKTARKHGVDMVIAMGGGSVIDAGKAIAALVPNREDIFSYLEVIGKGLPLSKAPIPSIAIPTTAGTGAEVTCNSVLSSIEHKVKVSLRSPSMFPNLAIVDPDLTLSMPPAITASTGLDALTQLIEAFVSNKANPMTDALCREGISRAARSLYQAFKEGQDIEAREDMSIASLFGGCALANAKLGAVHGIAGPLGGMIPIPHGTACGRFLPLVMKTNVAALYERCQESEAIKKYKEIAVICTTDKNADVEDGIKWISSLCKKLDIRGIADFGMTEEDIPNAVEKAEKASSMKGNPVVLTQKELTLILSAAMKKS